MPPSRDKATVPSVAGPSIASQSRNLRSRSAQAQRRSQSRPSNGPAGNLRPRSTQPVQQNELGEGEDEEDDDNTLAELTAQIIAYWRQREKDNSSEDRKAWRNLVRKFCRKQQANHHGRIKNSERWAAIGADGANSSESGNDGHAPDFGFFPAWALANLPRRLVHTFVRAEYRVSLQLRLRPNAGVRVMKQVAQLIRKAWLPPDSSSDDGSEDQDENHDEDHDDGAAFDDTYTLLALTFGTRCFSSRRF